MSELARQEMDSARHTLDMAIYGSLEAEKTVASQREAYRKAPSITIRQQWERSERVAAEAQEHARLASDAYEYAEHMYQRSRTPAQEATQGAAQTYTEDQIRAVYDDSGFANTADGLIEALRSLS